MDNHNPGYVLLLQQIRTIPRKTNQQQTIQHLTIEAVQELSAPVGYNRDDRVLKAVVGKDGSVVLLEMTNERIPGEPVQPEEPEVPVTPDMPVPPSEKPPKTGDNRTIVKVAVVVLCLAGIVAGVAKATWEKQSPGLFLTHILLKKKKNGEEVADEDCDN